MPEALLVEDAATLAGTLHIFVAFDWGDEIDLEHVRRLMPAESLALARRPRTPPSFAYHPAPLQLTLHPVRLEFGGLGEVTAQSRLILFDFAAVSVALRVPLQLPIDRLLQLAAMLADPAQCWRAAREAIMPVYQQLLPAIRRANFPDDLVEEYFVFEFANDHLIAGTGGPEKHKPGWIANLVHLDSGSLSAQETEEALRLQLSYSPADLLVADWAAAALIDRDCEETLQVIEFANLQLLQYRSLDQRLDASFTEADELIRPLTRSWLPFWRMYNRPLRKLGELKVDAEVIFERTGNTLKLTGDPYLARVYRLLAARFHLESWEKSIIRKLDVAEGVHQVVSDQAATFRGEFLEVLIVVLIVLEIVLALAGH